MKNRKDVAELVWLLQFCIFKLKLSSKTRVKLIEQNDVYLKIVKKVQNV